MADETDDVEIHPDDQHGVNRQFVLGGVVVALTLAIAAWLAYGVVQRSTTSPRAAGLVPDDSSGAPQRATTSGSTPSHRTSTTAAKATTTTTTRKRGRTRPGSSATFASEPPPSQNGIEFAALWHAYSDAWITECHSIWRHSTNGKLYDPDDIGSAYTIDDCTRTLDKLFLTANVTTVPLAQREGRNDAASFAAQLTLKSQLCWIDPATDATRGCWTGD